LSVVHCPDTFVTEGRSQYPLQADISPDVDESTYSTKRWLSPSLRDNVRSTRCHVGQRLRRVQTGAPAMMNCHNSVAIAALL